MSDCIFQLHLRFYLLLFDCACLILQIVDQQVKPKYLKNYMKNLKSLYIDWQEEIASA